MLSCSATMWAPQPSRLERTYWKSLRCYCDRRDAAQVGHFQGKQYVITSDRFLELEELPRRIVFIRGGYISLEFAHVAARAGAEVTIPAYPPILQRVPRKSHQSPCVVVGSRETSGCQNSTIQALSSRCSLNVASTCFMQFIQNGIPDGI